MKSPETSLRFEASDLGNSSQVEAAIDAVTLTCFDRPEGGQLVFEDVRPALTIQLANSNPCRSCSALRCGVPAAGPVELAVLDITGRVRRVLMSGARLSAGEHRVRWDGCDPSGRALPAGVYYARLRAGGRTATCKIIRVD